MAFRLGSINAVIWITLFGWKKPRLCNSCLRYGGLNDRLGDGANDVTESAYMFGDGKLRLFSRTNSAFHIGTLAGGG